MSIICASFTTWLYLWKYESCQNIIIQLSFDGELLSIKWLVKLYETFNPGEA